MNNLDTIKYLWLWCKSRNLLIKDKYFSDVVINNQIVYIKPAYKNKEEWIYLTIDKAKWYLEGMISALTSITMKNL